MTARYRAPADDGAMLAVPPLEQIPHLLDVNARALRGSPFHELRDRAQAEVAAAASAYFQESGEPIPSLAPSFLVAGHQPELFHPGVWVKNFVLHRLASQAGRSPLNLVVDNDAAKHPEVHVPIWNDDPGQVRTEAVPFDGLPGDRPYEEYRVVRPDLFHSFAARIAEVTTAWPFRPMLTALWPRIVHEVEVASVGEAFARVRRQVERSWGVNNAELPVSRLAETSAFANFAHRIVADLPRFHDAYNGAIRAYRAANRLRSKNHPAPELAVRDGLLEAPFWAWKADGRRGRLWVSRTVGNVELFAEREAVGRWPLDSRGFERAWLAAREAGWKIRPRALTLTLFVRLCLADGFIHGIGGGKYDEVSNEIARRFFGLEPPGYAVVTATARLPLGRFPATVGQLHDLERLARDLDWNPDHFPITQSAQPDAVLEKARLIQEEPRDRLGRRAWFRALQRVTREMRASVASAVPGVEERLQRTRRELAANAILGSREYAWLLFPAELLEYLASMGSNRGGPRR